MNDEWVHIHVTELSLRAVTCNTCYGWVCLIFPWCYNDVKLPVLDRIHRQNSKGTTSTQNLITAPHRTSLFSVSVVSVSVWFLFYRTDILTLIVFCVICMLKQAFWEIRNVAPPEKGVILHPYLPITTTFLFHQGGHCGQGFIEARPHLTPELLLGLFT